MENDFILCHVFIQIVNTIGKLQRYNVETTLNMFEPSCGHFYQIFNVILHMPSFEDHALCDFPYNLQVIK